MITELCRLIYTYSEYFNAQWVNCTKMCNKIQKTTIFSTYLPNLEALWHEFAHVFTVSALCFKIGPHWPAPAVQFVNNFFFCSKKMSSFLPIESKKRIILHFFSLERAHCSRTVPKRPNLLKSMKVVSGSFEHALSCF